MKKRAMANGGSKMPVMRFGSGKGALELSVGKRGRIQLKGTASFTSEGAQQFLERVQWYVDQMVEPTPAPTLEPQVMAVLGMEK